MLMGKISSTKIKPILHKCTYKCMKDLSIKTEMFKYHKHMYKGEINAFAMLLCEKV